MSLREALSNQARKEDNGLDNPLIMNDASEDEPKKRSWKDKMRPDYDSEPPAASLGEDGNYYANDNRWNQATGEWESIQGDEPVYYFTMSGESSKRDTDSFEYDEFGNVITKDTDFAGNGKALSASHGWLTESQIRDQWESDTNMVHFKQANPDMTFDEYMGFMKESTTLHAQGINRLGEEGISEEHQALYDKYGIETKYTASDGAVFEFNGGTMTKTVDGVDMGSQLLHAAAGGILGMGVAGALSPALQGALGSGLGKGVGAGLSNAVTQGIITGDIDPRSVLASGLMAGLNPGGFVSDKLGFVPDSAGGGFISGAVDNLASSGLATGDVDFGDALLAGLIRGGSNAVGDFFGDMSDRSVEDRMKFLDETLKGEYTQEELYKLAMAMPGTGTSDLGGLVGKDGIFSFIDEVDTSFVNKFLGGGSFDPGSVFIGPDGEHYTDVEMIEMGYSPSDIYTATINGGDIDGFTSGYIEYNLTPLGKAWEKFKELPGVSNVNDFIQNGLDQAARQQFISEYGIDPYNPDNLPTVKDILLYGRVDETYTWSDNPRGDSEVIGRVPGFDDQWSTGPDWEGGYVEVDGQIVPLYEIIAGAQAAANSGESLSSIMTNLTETYGEGVADIVMPGSETDTLGSILQGIVDGINTPGSDENGNNTIVTPGGSGEDDEDDLRNPLTEEETPPPPVLPPEEETPPPPVLPPEEETPPPPVLPPDEVPPPPPVLPPEEETPPPPVLPPEGGKPPPVLPPGGNGGPPLLPGMMGGGATNPEWGELYGYSPFDVYKGKGLEPVQGLLRGLS